MIKPSLFALASTALLLGCGLANAQSRAEPVDFGKREFESSCASCHGMGAKGDGPLRPYLTRSAPDLTGLAKSNGGVFPMDRLYKAIDGGTVGAHGTRDMPVWGQVYRVRAAEYYVDVNYDEQAFVRGRILALLEYINRLQVK